MSKGYTLNKQRFLKKRGKKRMSKKKGKRVMGSPPQLRIRLRMKPRQRRKLPTIPTRYSLGKSKKKRGPLPPKNRYHLFDYETRDGLIKKSWRKQTNINQNDYYHRIWRGRKLPPIPPNRNKSKHKQYNYYLEAFENGGY